MDGSPSLLPKWGIRPSGGRTAYDLFVIPEGDAVQRIIALTAMVLIRPVRDGLPGTWLAYNDIQWPIGRPNNSECIVELRVVHLEVNSFVSGRPIPFASNGHHSDSSPIAKTLALPARGGDRLLRSDSDGQPAIFLAVGGHPVSTGLPMAPPSP